MGRTKNKAMKKTFLSIVFLFGASFLMTAQTVEEVVAKHIKAIGGAEKLSAVKSVSMDNTLGAQGMEFENKMVIIVGKAMRSESKIMGNDMVQAFDGQTAWAIMPSMMGGTGDPEPMPEELSKGLKGQTNPFPLFDYAARGSKVELLGSEKVKDSDAFHLKLTSADGNATEFWVGAENGYVVKIKATQNGQEAEMFYSKFKEVEGVTFPMSMEMNNPMAGTITIDTKTVTINGVIDETIFKLPAKK
jgi:outer membrane lipoprotein-sorting protein